MLDLDVSADFLRDAVAVGGAIVRCVIVDYDVTVGGSYTVGVASVGGVAVGFEVVEGDVIVDYDVSVGGGYAESDTILHSGYDEGGMSRCCHLVPVDNLVALRPHGL